MQVTDGAQQRRLRARRGAAGSLKAARIALATSLASLATRASRATATVAPTRLAAALAERIPSLTVEVEGPDGKREIDFADFHLLPGDTPAREHALEPGELITHVVLDAPLEGSRSGYLKLRDRQSYQFALASSAVIVRMDGNTIREARVAMGGVGTKPWRAPEVEAALKGKPASEKLFADAARLAFENAIAYAHNGYKIPLGQQAIVRNLSDLTAA